MIFIFFSLITDSTDIDTTHIDSIKIYQVPEVFNYEISAISEKSPFQFSVTHKPEPWDLDILDLINSTNYHPFYAGPGQWLSIGTTGRSTRNTDIFINGRRIYDPFHGYTDLLWFTPGSIDMIGVEHNYGILPIVKISTRTNQDVYPLSSINYWSGAYGTNQFNIAYSRPFNDQLGIYLNGHYDKGNGTRINSDHRIYRLYMNNYFGSFLRSDLLYYSNEYGFPGDDQDTSSNKANIEVLDFGIGLGGKSNKFLLGITSFRNIRPDSYNANPVENRYILFSLQNANYLSWRRFLIEYGFEAFYNSINSGLTPGINDYRLITGNIDIIWTSGNFTGRIKNKVESNEQGIFYVPGGDAGYTIGNTTVFGRTGRYVRIPTYLESCEYGSPYHDFYGYIHGNPLLANENMWGGEIGIKMRYLELSFYDYYYDCRIVYSDTNPYSFINIQEQNVYGLELNSEYNFYLRRDTIGNKSLAIVISANASHCLIDKNILGQPLSVASTGIGIRHESNRLGFAFLINGRYAGERNFGNGQIAEPFFEMSPVVYIRFIALSASMHIENIFDHNYYYIPDYRMAGRHILFGIKWNFRN